MIPDPHLVYVMTVATGAAWLMTKAGLAKNLLEPRRRRHHCVLCGQHRCRC